MAWFTAASSGSVCVAAYDAIGAASLADSYTNEANPGTYTAAPGVAPTWAYGTGWTFNGSTQYLTTGVVPSSGYSLIVRYAVASIPIGAIYTVAGRRSSGAADRFGVTIYDSGGTDRIQYHSGSFSDVAAARLDGVAAVAGQQGYWGGVADGGAIGGWGANGASSVDIGRRGGEALYHFPGSVQALAIYSGTIDATDVATITTAMLALPTAAGSPASILAQMHHHHAVFGG